MASESFTAIQQDTRAFADLQQALLDDLNRPDLQNQAFRYIQDAIRYFSRQAFSFNEIDNAVVPVYANATTYPQGSCIRQAVAGTTYVFCALNTGLSAAAGAPAWPATIFTVPPSAFPPPASGTAGTVNDNGGPPTGIIWANIGIYSAQIHTQLSTVYNVNQYTPTFDYAIPKLIEVTWAGNLRIPMDKITYAVLRSYDVIRPTPPSTYPTKWARFQGLLYFWPYPVGFYPITLSYVTAPPMVRLPTDSNFWTTTAERLVRKQAQANIEQEVLHDPDAAALSMQAVVEEKRTLRSLMIQKDGGSGSGIPPSPW